MGTLQLLPDSVLRKQVCHQCSQFLSVPPIMTSDSGETLCGRCFNDFKETELEYSLFTKSAFNIIAERFLFKCINHLNGCNEILKFSETQTHEKICTYESQECFFCSFSGNLSQILNHCLKLHPDIVSFDGRVFFLRNQTFKKQMILVLKDHMYYIIFNVGNDLFTITISPVTKCSPGKIDQYGVRFFKPEDAEMLDYIHSDYGVLNGGKETFSEAKLCCEVLVQEVTLEAEELELKQRLANLRRSEKDANKLKQDLQDWSNKLSHENENHQAALNIIKKMYSGFFKCHSCTKITLEQAYFCPYNHCVCKSCLGNLIICKSCKTGQTFKKLEDIENFMLSCDWDGCKKIFGIKDYMKHKNECLQRPYECPLVNCNQVIISSQKLVEHWHCVVSTLIVDSDKIIFENYVTKEYYWLIKHDLYRVFINFDAEHIQIIIDKVNVLIPNQISFKCFGYYKGCWLKLTSTMFYGDFFCTESRSKVKIIICQ